MGKAKSKGSKPKVDLKQMLIAKAEYIVLGMAGLFLVIFLAMGFSAMSDAKDPKKMAQALTSQASMVQSGINSDNVDKSAIEGAAELPAWVKKPPTYPTIPQQAFGTSGPLFDPTANPSTKRENPKVLSIQNYQVDLIRAAMPGYDIIYDSENTPWIGVIVAKKVDAQDKEKQKQLAKSVIGRGSKGRRSTRPSQPPPGGGAPGQPGGGLGGPGGPGLPGGPGGPGLPGGPGGGEDDGYGGYGYGDFGGSYEADTRRVEKAVEYVQLKELDKAIENGKTPAMTVIPLRMVTMHAEVPFKEQLREIKKALRLPGEKGDPNELAAARRWGPIYDGYEIQRKVTRVLPEESQPVTIQDWAPYKFEDKYVELINSRKLKDQVEDGYLASFIRYDMALALPLPELVPELGKYPPIRLESINATIKEWERLNRKPPEASELQKRLDQRWERDALYRPQTGATTGAGAFFGGEQYDPDGELGGMGGIGGIGKPGFPGPGMGSPTPGGYRPGDGGYETAAPSLEIDHLLLRFVDVDVKPGYTYQYRVRLRMLNPNYDPTDDPKTGLKTQVANPADAKIERLYSSWTAIRDSITVPTESHLYALDPEPFREKIDEEFQEMEDDLRDKYSGRQDQLRIHMRQLEDLKARQKPDDNQAVVEVCTWLEQVRTDTGGKREPVGAWVVADMPVSRGQLVGRKHYVKLPLWSSVAQQYVLREVTERVVLTRRDVKNSLKPKGWMVDFSTPSVMVDFTGGKVTTKTPSGKTVTEEVHTELLIVRPDGSLVVKKSDVDEADKTRESIVKGWEEWVEMVEKRPAPTDNGSAPGEFDRDRGGSPGSPVCP